MSRIQVPVRLPDGTVKFASLAPPLTTRRLGSIWPDVYGAAFAIPTAGLSLVVPAAYDYLTNSGLIPTAVDAAGAAVMGAGQTVATDLGMQSSLGAPSGPSGWYQTPAAPSWWDRNWLWVVAGGVAFLIIRPDQLLFGRRR
jgi:hypothetical protein